MAELERTTATRRHARLSPTSPAGFSTAAVHAPARVNVTCVTPLGEEVASIS
jgi:hypothetical protein